MGKDVGALREAEAQRERQRVAETRIGERKTTEIQKQEAADKAAQERSEAAKAGRQKAEDMIKLREEWLAREETAKAEATKRMQQRTATLGKEIERVQGPEEEARKIFLKRVETEAEGLPADEAGPPEIPKPAIPRPAPRVQAPTPPAKRPAATGTPWTKITISLVSLAILGVVATFWYWYFVVRPETPAAPPTQPAEQPEQPVEEKPVISAPQITEALVDAGYRVPQTPRTINTLIIHSIYNILEGDPYSVSGVLEEYRQLNVAHHYLIARDGAVYRVVAEENIAYHAGPSRNDSSIGIGIISTENDSPTQAQYEALAGLAKQLKEKYAIPGENIVRRQDVIAGTKNNPANFDWQYFNTLINP